MRRARIFDTAARHPSAVCAASHAAQAKAAAHRARAWGIAAVAGAGVILLVDCLIWAGVLPG